MKSWKLAIVVVALTCAGCTDQKEADFALKASGYSDISFTGYSFFGCAKDESFCTGFVARAPSGQRVTGAVGNGWVFKGAVIHLFGPAQ